MYKKLLFLFIISAATIQLKAQSLRIDSVAVSILDHMSATIGDLASCSMTVKTNYDVESTHLGLVKHSTEEQVFMQGPNKMLIRSDGDKGSRSFVYNGSTLSYYSYDKNQFAEVQAAGTLMEMIDTVNKLYGVDFPVADFFLSFLCGRYHRRCEESRLSRRHQSRWQGMFSYCGHGEGQDLPVLDL